MSLVIKTNQSVFIIGVVIICPTSRSAGICICAHRRHTRSTSADHALQEGLHLLYTDKITHVCQLLADDPVMSYTDLHWPTNRLQPTGLAADLPQLRLPRPSRGTLILTPQTL